VLCPNHHALFDEGLWSVTDAGKVLLSKRLSLPLAAGLAESIPSNWEVDATCVRWHRQHVLV
jgi:predicted restriction endonuclease